MAKACDFCEYTNSYICNPAYHCGQCPKGHQEQNNETATNALDEKFFE